MMQNSELFGEYGRGVRCVEATKELVRQINPSSAFVDEIKMLLGNVDVNSVIDESFDMSDIGVVFLRNDRPIAFLGVQTENSNVYGNYGKIYLIMDELSFGDGVALVSTARKVIKKLEDDLCFIKLYNIKHSMCKKSIDWLRHIGFNFMESEFESDNGGNVFYFERSVI